MATLKNKGAPGYFWLVLLLTETCWNTLLSLSVECVHALYKCRCIIILLFYNYHSSQSEAFSFLSTQVATDCFTLQIIFNTWFMLSAYIDWAFSCSSSLFAKLRWMLCCATNQYSMYMVLVQKGISVLMYFT